MSNRNGTRPLLNEGEVNPCPEPRHGRAQTRSKKPPQIRARYIWMVVLFVVVGAYTAVWLKEQPQQQARNNQGKTGTSNMLLEISRNPDLTPEERRRAEEELNRRFQ